MIKNSSLHLGSSTKTADGRARGRGSRKGRSGHARWLSRPEQLLAAMSARPGLGRSPASGGSKMLRTNSMMHTHVLRAMLSRRPCGSLPWCAQVPLLRACRAPPPQGGAAAGPADDCRAPGRGRRPPRAHPQVAACLAGGLARAGAGRGCARVPRPSCVARARPLFPASGFGWARPVALTRPGTTARAERLGAAGRCAAGLGRRGGRRWGSNCNRGGRRCVQVPGRRRL